MDAYLRYVLQLISAAVYHVLPLSQRFCCIFRNKHVPSVFYCSSCDCLYWFESSFKIDNILISCQRFKMYCYDLTRVILVQHTSYAHSRTPVGMLWMNMPATIASMSVIHDPIFISSVEDFRTRGLPSVLGSYTLLSKWTTLSQLSILQHHHSSARWFLRIEFIVNLIFHILLYLIYQIIIVVSGETASLAWTAGKSAQN